MLYIVIFHVTYFSNIEALTLQKKKKKYIEENIDKILILKNISENMKKINLN